MFKIFETQKFWVQKIRIFSKLLKKISTIFLQFLRPKNFKYILISISFNEIELKVLKMNTQFMPNFFLNTNTQKLKTKT